jgi:hypothetical protein
MRESTIKSRQSALQQVPAEQTQSPELSAAGWIPFQCLLFPVRLGMTQLQGGSGLNLRAMATKSLTSQKAVKCMTKYCEMITDKNKIRYCLEKALKIAQQGRPGLAGSISRSTFRAHMLKRRILYPYDGENSECCRKAWTIG